MALRGGGDLLLDGQVVPFPSSLPRILASPLLRAGDKVRFLRYASTLAGPPARRPGRRRALRRAPGRSRSWPLWAPRRTRPHRAAAVRRALLLAPRGDERRARCAPGCGCSRSAPSSTWTAAWTRRGATSATSSVPGRVCTSSVSRSGGTVGSTCTATRAPRPPTAASRAARPGRRRAPGEARRPGWPTCPTPPTSASTRDTPGRRADPQQHPRVPERRGGDGRARRPAAGVRGARCLRSGPGRWCARRRRAVARLLAMDPAEATAAAVVRGAPARAAALRPVVGRCRAAHPMGARRAGRRAGVLPPPLGAQERAPVTLAGDWLVQPCVEGAVRSGEAAAAALLS